MNDVLTCATTIILFFSDRFRTPRAGRVSLFHCFFFCFSLHFAACSWHNISRRFFSPNCNIIRTILLLSPLLPVYWLVASLNLRLQHSSSRQNCIHHLRLFDFNKSEMEIRKSRHEAAAIGLSPMWIRKTPRRIIRSIIIAFSCEKFVAFRRN